MSRATIAKASSSLRLGRRHITDFRKQPRFRSLELLPHTEGMIRGRFSLAGLVLLAGAISAQQAPLQVPLVGCETGGQVPVETPKASTASLPISPQTAAKLAYYASGNGLGVLAPRGWFCFGTIGSGGDELLVTTDPADSRKHFMSTRPGFRGPVVYLTHRLGGTSGRFSVAEVIMRVFPDHKAFAEGVTEMFPLEKFAVGPYPGDRLTYESKTIVEYTTPAHTDGLGTYARLEKNGRPINGVAILIDQAEPDLLLLSVRLPQDLNDAVSIIVHQGERDTEHHPELLRLRPFKPLDIRR